MLKKWSATHAFTPRDAQAIKIPINLWHFFTMTDNNLVKRLSTPLQWELSWNPERVKCFPHSFKQQTKPHDIQREKLNSRTGITKQTAQDKATSKLSKPCGLQARNDLRHQRVLFQGGLARLWIQKHGGNAPIRRYRSKVSKAAGLLSVSETEHNVASNDILLTRWLKVQVMDARAGD